MAEFRLNEAIAEAEKKGIKVRKIDLAAKIWKGSKRATLQVSINNLCNGTIKRVAPEWVDVICKELKTTPNFLFNIH